MQSMRELIQTEPFAALAQAICNREGQVLSVHAAPLGLSAGDTLTDCMKAGERQFFLTLPPDANAICLCRRTAVLCLRRPFGGLLVRCIPLAASPHAAAAVYELAESLGIRLSPGLQKKAKVSKREIEDAAAELLRLCGIGFAPCGGERSAEQLVHDLAELPPLCRRHPIIKQAEGNIPDGIWPMLIYCLMSFFCRMESGRDMELALTVRDGRPFLQLEALTPIVLPQGRSCLSLLAVCFADVPELAVCSRLAVEHGIAVEIFSDGSGRICLTAEQVPDPALLGFKQPLGFIDEAKEAAEAEWCRLLRAAVQAER